MKKTILIAGGTGLIGSQLATHLTEQGHVCRILTRNRKTVDNIHYFYWNPDDNVLDNSAFDGVDAVVNLAGAGIVDKPWTEKRKEIILRSRVTSTQLLCQTLEKSRNSPGVIINASAIGIYPERDVEQTEETILPEVYENFLAHVCHEWETTFWKYCPKNTKGIILRIGLVLSRDGGVLPKMLPGTQIGVGTYFGDGSQMMSWIHIEDLCRSISHLIDHGDSQSFNIYNACAPYPVSQKTLITEILDVRCRVILRLSIPKALLELILGEMANAILSGNNIKPRNLIAADFKFQYPKIKEAIEELL